MTNSFRARSTLTASDRTYEIWSLAALPQDKLARLPYSLKILLENLLRFEDGVSVTRADIEALLEWNPAANPSHEIAFTPARVILQDFTGVPCVVDLAAMRDAIVRLGGDPERVNPLAPAELVIDHSVQVDEYGFAGALAANTAIEFARNNERYAFLRWGQTAFRNFAVVPPNTGIVHQVNLEYLGRVIFDAESNGTRRAYPDTLVGTDSHTTMINGLGRARLGRGRHRGGSRHARPAGDHAHPAGHRLPARRRACSPGPRRRTWCSPSPRCCARRAWSTSSSSSSATDWATCRSPTAPRSPTWRPSTAAPAACSRSMARPSATWSSPAARSERIDLVTAYAKAQGMWRNQGATTGPLHR